MAEDQLLEILFTSSDKKPSLEFFNVEIPEPTILDQRWFDVFKKHAIRKKSKKCARLIEEAVIEQNKWRLSAALEYRHQQEDPDSIFSCHTPVVRMGYLDSHIWHKRDASDTMREMLLNGLLPQTTHLNHGDLVDSMASFHRDSLMNWHQKGCGEFLQPLFYTIILKGTHKDILTLINDGADLTPDTLRQAIKRKDLSVMKTLVDHGANIFENYNSLVNQAQEFGCLDIVKFLHNTKDEKERAAGLKEEAKNGWVALSETFAEFSRPQSPDGSQLVYQIDFETRLMSMFYKQKDQITPSAVIDLSELNNPELLKTAADMIEKSGYKRPDIDRCLDHSPGPRKITSVSHNKLSR